MKYRTETPPINVDRMKPYLQILNIIWRPHIINYAPHILCSTFTRVNWGLRFRWNLRTSPRDDVNVLHIDFYLEVQCMMGSTICQARSFLVKAHFSCLRCFCVMGHGNLDDREFAKAFCIYHFHAYLCLKQIFNVLNTFLFWISHYYD